MIRVLLISNMYPAEENSSFGVFVKNFETMINATPEFVISQKVVIDKFGVGKLTKLMLYLQFYAKILIQYLWSDFDIAYVHFPIYSAPILSLLPQKKLVLNFHGSDVMGQGRLFNLLRSITSRLVKRASLIVVPSSFLEKQLISKFSRQDNILENKLFISPSGGINEKAFYPSDKSTARERINVEGIYTIGFISRFDQGKGWDVFLEAVAHLKMHVGISFHAIVVGDGAQRNEFFAKIDSLNIKDKITYFPRKKQKELANYFNSLDLFIASSTLQESLGLIGLEAMSCGVPVAGSDQAGLATFIVDTKNGYLFTPGNAVELADKVIVHNNLGRDEKLMLSKQAVATASKYSSELVNNALRKQLMALID